MPFLQDNVIVGVIITDSHALVSTSMSRYDFLFAIDAPDGVMTGTFFDTAILTVP